MSAQDILIEEIKRQPESVVREVLRYLKTIGERHDVDPGVSPGHHHFTIDTAADGLPVIRANGGTITSQQVRMIESQIP